MSYTLFVDRPEVFECEVSVKNANLKNSFARLIVETEDLSLIFKGKIEEDKCVIPIRKLKGLLDESTKGKMHLEVIVDDTYFSPWSDTFSVEEHTSVKVKIKEQKETSKKPMLEVKVKQKELPLPVKELIYIFEKFGINKHNYSSSKRGEFNQILKEYFKSNKEFLKKVRPIISETIIYLK